MTESNDAAEILKNPTIKRFIWILWAGILIFGSVLILVSFLLSWKPIKIALFFVGATAVFSTLLGIILKYADLKINAKNQRISSIALAIWLTVALFFFPNSTFRWIVSGGIVIVFLLIAFLSRLMSLFLDSFITRLFYQNFKAGKNNYAWGVTGIAVFEPGIPTLYGKRILRELLMEKLKFRSGTPYFFVNILSYRKHSPEYALLAVKSSLAMIIVTRPEQQQSDEFKTMLQSYIQNFLGKVFIIQIASTPDSTRSMFEGRGIESFEFVPSTRDIEQEDISTIVAQITNQLSVNVIPIGESDDKLHYSLRTVPRLIASHGLPPLANCYLRVRLSQSNVERFMGLLDCIEMAVKISVMYLSINQWSKNFLNDSFSYSLNRPTLGFWTGRLKDLGISGNDDEVTTSIIEFLEQPVEGTPLQLIQIASSQGFEWKGETPTTYLEWLNWFTWMRNVSRGHGTVEESQVAPLWHGLHVSFLYIVLQLQSLMIDSSLIESKENMNSGKLEGWNRLVIRQEETEEKESDYKIPYLVVGENTNSNAFSTFPFMILKEGEVLFLNNAHKNFIEYIGYGSGIVTRLEIDGTNPFMLWKSKAEN